MPNDLNPKKAKHAYSRQEAVEYLRRLADHLENGAIQVSNEEVEFEGLIKVKESLKTKKGKTSVKVQFKVSTQEVPHDAGEDQAPEPKIDEAAPSEDAGEEQPSSYRKLKKDMSRRFKALGQALAEGAPIDPAEVAAFCDHGLQMVTFEAPDKIKTRYPQFEAAIQALRAAGESGDPAALKEAHDSLGAMKKACQKDFK